jgi:hypothetical protein
MTWVLTWQIVVETFSPVRDAAWPKTARRRGSSLAALHRVIAGQEPPG